MSAEVRKKRDPREGMRPWIKGLPVAIAFLICVAFYPLVVAVGAAKGITEGHREAMDIIKRFF